MISAILLAGGVGSRMGSSTPKQFKKLKGKILALYSFEFFHNFDPIDEIIVVCATPYRNLFHSSKKHLAFADPGSRRQDSVFQGLCKTASSSKLICIHDAARPFIEKSAVERLIETALKNNAAALASPLVNTLKQVDEKRNVIKTLPREELWEIQTPQAIRRELLFQAYALAKKTDIQATDDLSLIEALQLPTTVVPSSSHNIKITTPFDWVVAETLCNAIN